MTTALGTRLGALLGAGLGQDATRGEKFLYALTDFAAANYYATQTAGGEAGDAAGFGIALLTVPVRVTATTQKLANRTNGAQTAGWQVYYFTNNLYVSTVGASSVASTGERLTASDAGALQLVVLQTTGSVQKFFARRRKVSELAFSGWTAGTDPMVFGARSTGAEPAVDFAHVATLSWRGVLSDAAIEALYDMVRARGDLPTSIAGVTVTHKWPDRALLKSLTAPATIPDVVTGAPVDAMTKTGTPTVTAIDLSASRAWSYESMPLTYGATSLSLSDHLTHPDALRVPDNSDWHFLLYWRVDSQTGAAVRVLIGDLEGSPTTTHGWCLYTNGTNSSLILQTIQASGTGANAPIASIPAADVGKLMVTGGSYEQSTGKLRLYNKRVEQGAGVTVVGYKAPTAAGASWIGRAAPGQPATGVSIFGWEFGATPLALAEYQAACEATMSTEDVVRVPGATRGLWSLKQSRIDQTATITDRVASAHFSRVGQPALASVYARSWAW